MLTIYVNFKCVCLLSVQNCWKVFTSFEIQQRLDIRRKFTTLCKLRDKIAKKKKNLQKQRDCVILKEKYYTLKQYFFFNFCIKLL